MQIKLLSDARARFVSMVKHGANRTPFVVLKKEGGIDMEKVVQSVIIPNSLPDEERTKALEGFRSDEPVKTEDTTTYIQVAEDVIDLGTKECIKVGNVLHIIAKLKEEDGKTKSGEAGKESVTTKEMSLQTLAMDFYAMGDLVLGAMHQQSFPEDKRGETIISALDSFRSDVALFFSGMKEGNIKHLTSKDVEGLPYPLRGSKEKGSQESESDKALEAALADVQKSIGELAEKIGGQADTNKKLSEALEGVKSDTEKLKNTLKSSRPAPEDEKRSSEEKSSFKGVLFRGRKAAV